MSSDDQMGPTVGGAVGKGAVGGGSPVSHGGGSGPLRLHSGVAQTLAPGGVTGGVTGGRGTAVASLTSVQIVGRDAELAQLDAIFLRAVDYHAPQLVTIVGGQGVGKSRLSI